MDAAAGVGGSDVVAGRGDLLRGGRGREGRGTDRREGVGVLSSAPVAADGDARSATQQVLRFSNAGHAFSGGRSLTHLAAAT